jgi:protein-S-isoprenylcysteine O-methyltransferase Ste14
MMPHIPIAFLGPSPALHAITVAWLLWALSWAIAARFTNRTTKRSPWIVIPFIAIAAIVYFGEKYLHISNPAPLWHETPTLQWALLPVVVAGFAFAWWARITLGRLWSGTITLKEGHHIVDTGPYAIVRHPIYTGLLLSAAASVAAQGSAPALIVFALVVTTVTLKAWAEERFLSRELGKETYAAYRARVPMLVPFLPKSG